MWPSIVHYDFHRDTHAFSMPCYIFQGQLDHNTPSELVEAYFDAIEAPDKALIWFAHSGHGPLAEETGKFLTLLSEKFQTALPFS